MSIFTSLVGRPAHDWEVLLQNVLANGSFSAPTGGGTGLSIAVGNIHLDLIGTNLAISGARTITAGSITGFTLVDAGQNVITMTGLTLPTFSQFQTWMNGSVGIQPYSETFKSLFAPFFTNEAVTATGSNDAESVFGGNGVDHINAGGGDDYVRAGGGVDFLDGGAGQDFIDYSADVRTVGININLTTNTVVDNNIGAAIVDHISNFESVGGTSFADIIRGTDGNNALIGGGGGDILYGMLGDNFYQGGQGADTFVGGTGTGNGQWDKISYENEQGGAGITATFSGGNVTVVDTYGTTDSGTSIEEIKGSQYADTINGDGGDNSAEGMGGNDTFNMGGGFDTIEYQHETDAGATHGIIANLSGAQVTYSLAGFAGPQTVAAGHVLDSLGGNDTLINVEDIRATDFADIMVGGDGGMNLEGMGGSDIIYGGSGNDNIRGDDGGSVAGNDQLYGGLGNDSFKGGAGNDYIDGGDGFDDVNYNLETTWTGDDATHGVIVNLSSSALTNVTVAGIALTTVAAGTAIDTRNYVDTLVSIEHIIGTGYDDIIVGSDVGVVLEGNEGNDKLYGGAGNDELYGGAGNDLLVAGTGDNFMEGGAGTDTYVGGTLTGNGQWDAVSYRHETGGTGIVATFNGGGSISVTDTYGNAETGTGIDKILGSQYADTFTGSSGNDFAEGFAGNDTFNMGAGRDEVDYNHEQNDGSTQGVIVNLSTAAISATLNNGLETVQAGHARDSFGFTDTLNSVEDINGTNFNDYIVGSSADNNLSGFDGSDTIYGGDGNDTIRGDEGGSTGGNDHLYGENGNDSFKGGAGNDYIDGGAGWDDINYNLETTFTGDDATHGVIVNLSTSALVSVSVTGIASTTVAAGTAIDTRNYVDTLVSIEEIQGTGYDDYIVGSNGDNNFFGNGGNDTLIGGQGINEYWGGAGNDTIIGGTLLFNAIPGAFQNDNLHYNNDGGTQGIVATFTGNGNLTVIDTYGSTDTATSIENVTGSQFDDVFTGDSGFQDVNGMQGNDTINLGGGFDRVDYGGNVNMGIIANLSAATIMVNVGNGNETVLAGRVRDSFGFTDTLTGVEMIAGTNFDDYILMSSANDQLKGGGGADYLNGGAGFDTIDYNLETTFTSDSATHGVIVNMSTSALAGVSVAGIGTATVAAGTAIDARNFIDTLVSIEHIHGTGYDDIIYGSNVGNQLEGDGGNDVIKGGSGSDTIDGGSGRDTVVFAATFANTTRVHNLDGSWTVTSALDGTDTVTNAEIFQFADRKMYLQNPHGDFNADGTSDLLWFQGSSGTAIIRDLNNNVSTGVGNNFGAIGSQWSLQTTGDFNGDGSSDFMWKNTTTGQFYIWNVSNNVQSGSANLGNIGTNWSVVGSGDFNNDGTGDILWRNATNGQLYIYDMHNNAVSGAASLGVIGTEWQAVAVGDFNGDGTSDVMLQRSTDGLVYAWDLTNNAVSNSFNFGALGTNWKVMGAGDFNNDGISDLVLRDSNNGQLYLWMLDNQDHIASGSNLGAIGTAWTVAHVGDANGDGTSDLFLKNTTTGQFYIWDIVNGVHQGDANLGVVGADWNLI